jgi:dGTPase
VRAHPRQFVRPRDDEPLDTQVTDFIAGMTDRYAIDLYHKLFVPEPWVGA